MRNTSLNTVKKFCKNWNEGNIRCCRTAYRTATRYLKDFENVAPKIVVDTLIGCIEYHNFKDARNIPGSMYVKTIF